MSEQNHSLKTYIIVVASTFADKVGHKFFAYDNQSGGYPWFPDRLNNAHYFKSEEDALKEVNAMIEERFGEWGREGAKDFSIAHTLRSACCESSTNNHGLYTFQIGVVMVETAFNPDDLFEMKGTVIKRVHVDIKTYGTINTQPDKVVKWVK